MSKWSSSEWIKKTAESIPPEVLKMDILTPEEFLKLKPEFFALVYERRGMPPIRKFPITDAGNTYMSALSWGLTKKSLPDAARRIAAFFIVQAARKYGLDRYPFKIEILKESELLQSIPEGNVVSDTMAFGNTMTKSADLEHYYLLPGKKSYPVDNADDVKTASSYFDMWGDRLSPLDQHEYACNLVKKASEYNAPVSDRVKTYAGQHRNPAFMAKIASRVDLKPELKNVWSRIEKMASSLDNPTLIEMVAMIDKKASLNQYYGRVLSDPVLSVVTTEAPAEKVACDMSDEDLKKVPTAPMQKYFGKELADQFFSAPMETYMALDPEHQKLVKKMGQGLLS